MPERNCLSMRLVGIQIAWLSREALPLLAGKSGYDFLNAFSKGQKNTAAFSHKEFNPASRRNHAKNKEKSAWKKRNSHLPARR